MGADRDHRQRPGPARPGGVAEDITTHVAAQLADWLPGVRSAGKMPGGMLTRAISAVAQARDRPSSSPVVDALVISAPTSPVSQ